ncbi:rab11 family-interacting protein 4B isoform X6 [Parasteatoda tepidariorum]|uniref:rab11 family-interacting protein 4B isoform X6 n=1 Tax=Parasteatoda tepidariorum TaxID=114398 RepID=UPI0039BC6384
MASADEELVKQLREVFDLCDELKCGIISVNQLRDIVRKHFGGSEEEIAQLIECLDPNQHGVVTFADFCSGVVSTMQNKGTSFEETTLRYQKPNVLVSSPHLQVDGTARDDSSPPPPGDTDSAIATGSDVSRESLADKQDSCKRLSTSALANQLHRSGSRRNSQSSDEMYPLDVPMSIEDDVIDLNQKVQELQSQVATLTDHQVNTDQRYNRVKQENAALQNKIHSLEEQLRELEIRSEDRLETEQQKFKEIMARCERESKLELEQYATKLFQLQKEYMEMSEESFRLKTQIERLKQEKQDLQNQLYECTTELLNLRDEHHRLQESTRREREEFQTERANSNKLLDELSKELEKHSESAGETRLRSPSLLELPAQYRELQQELKKIKDENKLILETNEELNAQLLANSLQEGRTLVSQNSAISLADEFETLTKDDDISDFLSMVTDCFTLKIVSTSLILLYL